MSETGEAKPTQEELVNNQPPTFGIDTLKSLKPPSRKSLDEAARTAGSHGHIARIPEQDNPEDLVLQIQDIPSPPDAEPISRPKDIPQIRKKPLQPGDMMPFNKDYVLYDEDGNEVGQVEERRTDLVLVDIIREGKRAPIFVSRGPDGKIYRSKKIGTRWVKSSK